MSPMGLIVNYEHFAIIIFLIVRLIVPPVHFASSVIVMTRVGSKSLRLRPGPSPARGGGYIGYIAGKNGAVYMGVQCVVCCMFRSRFLRAGALCVHAHAMVRAQGRALCACLGPPGLRAGSALTRADVLVLLCVLRFSWGVLRTFEFDCVHE